MTLIIPANTLSDSGYNISNSLRFEASGHKLTRTYGTPTSQRIFTFSVWVKRSNFSGHNYLIGQNDTNEGYIRFTGPNGDELNLEDRDSGTGSSDFSFQTSMLFRDPSSWYHIVIAFDTTQSTDTNRRKVYVNGVQQTSFSASTIAPQNYDLQLNQSGPFQIGSTFGDLGAYLSDYYFIDGQQKAASVFGEFNDNGVWIPKDPTDVKENVTFGDNGFLLEFKETGTSANSSGMGADTSGEDNHWAATNLAAIDVTKDTPTNNFCTMSSIDTNTQASLSEGNTQLQQGSNYAGCNGTFGVANGKWYWEVKTPSPTASGENSSFGVTSIPHSTIGNNYLATSGTTEWAIMIDNADSDILKIHNNSTTDYSVNASSNDIFQIALDMDNNKIYFGRNGSFFASGDPAGNSNEAYSSVSGDPFLLPAFSINGNDTLQVNFGNPPYANSSSVADANGYGAFEYEPPSGYYALCTKNLAEFG